MCKILAQVFTSTLSVVTPTLLIAKCAKSCLKVYASASDVTLRSRPAEGRPRIKSHHIYSPEQSASSHPGLQSHFPLLHSPLKLQCSSLVHSNSIEINNNYLQIETISVP